MKKHSLDDYQLFLICCVFGSILWVYQGSFMCVTLFDQIIYVVGGVSFPAGAFIVKRYRLIEK